MIRMACFFLGCTVDDDRDCSCARCGAYLYEEYIESGFFAPAVQRWRALVAGIRPARCASCNRRLLRPQGTVGVTHFCGPGCESDWLPF